MAIVGVVTNKGLAESVKASSNQGWSIFPTRFGVSAGKGDLRPTREDTHTMWYQAPITDQTVVSENTIQFVCTIPPQVIETDEHINEIYMFGENSVDQTEFLLAVGQPTEVISYFKDGSITLRMHVTLANVQASQVFEFKYTGHRSIEDHNTSEGAHKELFGALSDQVRSLGESMLVENQIASGGAVYVDRDKGLVQVDDAKFYHKGVLSRVPAGSVSVPMSGIIGLGVWVSSEEDGSQKLTWGTRYNPAGDAFYEVHVIEDGYLKTVSAGTQKAEPVHSSVRRYDREANGSYIVNGLNVRVVETGDSHYVVQVAEGKAHVNGIEVEQRKVVEKSYSFDPDSERVAAELQHFQPDENGDMNVMVSNQPIAVDQPVKVNYTKSSTLGVDRGQVAGTKDLVVTNLMKVKSVRYGSSVFVEGRDFTVDGPYINWAAAGAEPPTGALYTVECEHLQEKTIDPAELYPAGFTFKGAVPDTPFYVDYHAQLPRKDLLVMDSNGAISRIKGKGDTRGMSVPKAPTGTLSIAELAHHWTAGVAPVVSNTGIVAVRADELYSMKKSLNDLYDLVAEERLARVAGGDDPRTKRGIFIEPFLDDSKRDGGAIQTALVDGLSQELTLASDVHTMDTKEFGRDDAPRGLAMLPYTLRAIVKQEAATGDMKVNPYSAFEPLPPQMALQPAVDNWTIIGNTRRTISQTRTEQVRMRSAAFSQTFGSSASQLTRETDRTLSNRTVTSTEELPYLRELNVSFEIEGFKPNEQVKSLSFGRSDVTKSLGGYGVAPVTDTILVGSNSELDTRPLYESASSAVQNWRRLSHAGSNLLSNELSSWNVKSGRASYWANSSGAVTLTSIDTFDNFDVTVRMRGLNGDDDWAGVVIAAVTVGNKTHTLTAVRAPRSSAAGSYDCWMIVKDFRQSTQKVLFSLKSQKDSVAEYGSWNRWPDGATIRVRRHGNTIQAWTSRMGQRDLVEASRYSFDLKSNPELSVFLSPGAWGFCTYSQATSFEVVSQANFGNLS